MIEDLELLGMMWDRRLLQQRLAHVLKRVGASNPQRTAINDARRIDRRKFRHGLRQNADAIAAHVMTKYKHDLESVGADAK